MQDIPKNSNEFNVMKKVDLKVKQIESGEILYSINLIPERGPLGVTIINSIIYRVSAEYTN